MLGGEGRGSVQRDRPDSLQEVGPGRRVTCRTHDTGGHRGCAPALVPQRRGNALAMHSPDLPRVSLHLGTRSPRRADGSWAQLPFGAAVREEGAGQRWGHGHGVRSGLLWVQRAQWSCGCRVRRGPAHRGEGLGAEVGVREGQAPPQPGPRGRGTDGLTGQRCLFSLMQEEGE